MAERVVYRVIAYGEWTRPRMRNFREQCCDCGLIHRLDFRIVDGQIEFRTRRDDRATAVARRRFRFRREKSSPVLRPSPRDDR
jgi:hypothetical protein